MEREALYWVKENARIQCTLCPHKCLLSNGQRGICGVRENKNGILKTLVYGSCSSSHTDPIEKKPLYHFYPGTFIYSIGTIGCTFHCLHCQNNSISQPIKENYSVRELSVEGAVKEASHKAIGIAFTYNEPTVWYEYAIDTAISAHKEDLKTVFVTNGYINSEPLLELSKELDAVNIDIKSMSPSFYRKVCKANLEPVLDSCLLYKNKGVHVELTYLVIPTKNDEISELKQFCKWTLENLGQFQVIHFTAFHPQYKMLNIPPTPIKKLLEAYSTAKNEGLKYVYLGNIGNGTFNNTYCHNCGSLLIKRSGYSSFKIGFSGKKCAKCGIKIPIVF